MVQIKQKVNNKTCFFSKAAVMTNLTISDNPSYHVSNDMGNCMLYEKNRPEKPVSSVMGSVDVF